MAIAWWHNGPVGGLSVPVYSGNGAALHAATTESADEFCRVLNELERQIELRMNTPPEVIDPDLLKPKRRRVLLLASYCGSDNSKCSDEFPCNDCLKMCNVAEVVVCIDEVRGSLGEIGAACSQTCSCKAVSDKNKLTTGHGQ
tara:strand:+ start:472 stop:900 length:429 start_codon:yes stop_codon:yes gene_type:complete